MSTAPRWREYLRLARRNVAADVDDELRFHIDMRVEHNIALGMPEDEARRDALKRFGDVGLVRDALVEHDNRKQTVEGGESIWPIWRRMSASDGARCAAPRRSPLRRR